ncbi:hybrid sensor histidine kinase/response regulator [Maritimibacter sp. 55A14]|uniref:PAS-domain containing protein n=1 Tax=Maritimibacter sp. 55A14 TaxID=2174844 RepID=UPI000D622D3A|nr:PAS-domain containing protein [Maritimibacter sp. 55A14]PWE29915.1 hybrid sensor histidine kinase/response regulator [Maritimibacter sp. 55A14]
MQDDRARTARLTRAGLNLIQQALTIYDADLRLAVCNARFQEMFDLPEWLATPGARFEDTIRYLAERGDYGEVPDLEEFLASRVEIARAFEPHYMERTRSNGRTISVEGSPLPQGGWVTVYTDITAIKRQEALLYSHSAELSEKLVSYSEELAQTNRQLAATISALEEAKRELTEMEARTRMTTEMMPAHIAHLDLSERYTYSNRRLTFVIPNRPQDILGLTAREALGRHAYAQVKPYIDRAYAGTSSVFEFTHEDSGRRIRGAFTPDLDAEGRVCGVYILSMDVTEESQARAALSQVRKRELAAQLTSGLAHDFSNLLTIILGMQGRLGKLEGLPEPAREIATATRAAALRGGRLLDRLADISGRRDLRPGPVDLPALLRDIGALASPSLPADVTLEVETGGLETPLLLDASSLQDSLLNLVLNARDAIGAAPGTIRLTANPMRDTWVEIAVEDTGPGFSEEALEQALNPFYTTKGGEGSGLGLAMVYDSTKLAGGRVMLTNRPGGGARVVLRLPLRPVAAHGTPKLVLLVEDSPDIRVTVREMLRRLGHTVLEAESAEEAEALAEIPDIDLVLTDITLAGTRSGLDLAEALAARGTAAVHLMTSLPARDAKRQAAARRFPLLAKPFTEAELAAALGRKAAE